jgi:hypothetical protein
MAVYNGSPLRQRPVFPWRCKICCSSVCSWDRYREGEISEHGLYSATARAIQLLCIAFVSFVITHFIIKHWSGVHPHSQR